MTHTTIDQKLVAERGAVKKPRMRGLINLHEVTTGNLTRSVEIGKSVRDLAYHDGEGSREHR